MTYSRENISKKSTGTRLRNALPSNVTDRLSIVSQTITTGNASSVSVDRLFCGSSQGHHQNSGLLHALGDSLFLGFVPYSLNQMPQSESSCDSNNCLKDIPRLLSPHTRCSLGRVSESIPKRFIQNMVGLVLAPGKLSGAIVAPMWRFCIMPQDRKYQE